MASSTEDINMNKDVGSSEKKKYVKCCCYLDRKCGLYIRHKEIDEMINVKELSLDTKSHLVGMNVMKSHDSNRMENDNDNEKCVNIHILNEAKKKSSCASFTNTFHFKFNCSVCCLYPNWFNAWPSENTCLDSMAIMFSTGDRSYLMKFPLQSFYKI